MSKTVPESKFTELKGLDRIQSTVHEMKCFFRELTKDEFGIDGEIELLTPKADGKGYEATAQIVKVQAKSGSKYVTKDKPDSFSTSVELSDLKLWQSSTFSVFLIVYHPGDDK